jgi:rSAM/selenodomain-associated transferase 2
MISVIIPTLNAGASVEATLASVAAARELVTEIVVSDGGSDDDTCDRAARAGCRVVVGERGRGAQLMRGAEQAQGGWLLFLHADTRLAPGWPYAARSFIERAGSDHRAAVFRFALDHESVRARILEALVAARVRLLALPYGDQGLLISRRLYDELGGFRPLPLMEDVDFVRRIGRARLALLAPEALTSAVRYRRGGYLRRMSRNLTCLALYAAGVPPRAIARLYG